MMLVAAYRIDADFVELARWYMPPMRSFYPSARACELAAVASMRPHSPVRVSTVIAIDEQTRATTAKGVVMISQLPWYAGKGWGRWSCAI